MLTAYVALVAEYTGFDASLLLRVAAAIQKQVARDVAPIWEVNATVAAFASLEDVPIGYWPVVVTTRDLGGQDGTHLDDDGSPYALVEAGPDWSLTASHECIEMILDPFGNRMVAGPSPREEQGRAEFLVEVCDPCQSAESAYTVNDILVADFVTPAYFEVAACSDPGAREAPQVRYSYSGRIARPREVLAGGYLCWRDPITRHWWQRSSLDGKAWTDVDLGALDPSTRGQRSLREVVNSFTQHHERLGHSVSGELAGRVSKRAALGARASRTRAVALRGHARSLPALAKPPAAGVHIHVLESPQALRSEPDLGAELDRAIASLAQKPELPDCARVLAALRSAKAQLAEIQANAARAGAPAAIPDGELALVQTALRSPLVTPHTSLLTGRNVVGFAQYDGLDVRWVATVWNHLFRPVVPFPIAPSSELVVHRLPAQATLALAGDWGTGNVAARRVGAQIAAANPTYTIHLGDVYYSGTEGEETDNLLAPWPGGSAGSFALNGNHEMYSGGQGYFGVALANEKFAAQAPYSYFALANDDWVIVGLDSAYAATSFYQVGALNEPQLAWLRALSARTLKRADGSRKRVIVLSHHQGIDLDGTKKSPGLWDQVLSTLGLPDYWYWGHLHGVAVFHPVTVNDATLNARLVGHGGVPYLADDPTAALAWTESHADAELVVDGSTRRSRNGYALLHLEGRTLGEELYDELGARRWTSAPG